MAVQRDVALHFHGAVAGDGTGLAGEREDVVGRRGRVVDGKRLAGTVFVQDAARADAAFGCACAVHAGRRRFGACIGQLHRPAHRVADAGAVIRALRGVRNRHAHVAHDGIVRPAVHPARTGPALHRHVRGSRHGGRRAGGVALVAGAGSVDLAAAVGGTHLHRAANGQVRVASDFPILAAGINVSEHAAVQHELGRCDRLGFRAAKQRVCRVGVSFGRHGVFGGLEAKAVGVYLVAVVRIVKAHAVELEVAFEVFGKAHRRGDALVRRDGEVPARNAFDARAGEARRGREHDGCVAAFGKLPYVRDRRAVLRGTRHLIRVLRQQGYAVRVGAARRCRFPTRAKGAHARRTAAQRARDAAVATGTRIGFRAAVAVPCAAVATGTARRVARAACTVRAVRNGLRGAVAARRIGKRRHARASREHENQYRRQRARDARAALLCHSALSRHANSLALRLPEEGAWARETHPLGWRASPPRIRESHMPPNAPVFRTLPS